jgi:hypothetical protein
MIVKEENDAREAVRCSALRFTESRTPMLADENNVCASEGLGKIQGESPLGAAFRRLTPLGRKGRKRQTLRLRQGYGGTSTHQRNIKSQTSKGA